MGVLNQTSRRQLLDLLGTVTIFDTRPGRDMMLRDLPARLVGKIERSDAKSQDLDQIVYFCDSWWPDGDTAVTDYPLRLLLYNTVDLTDGTQAGGQLQAFLDMLPAQLDPTVHARCPYPGMMPFRPEDSRFFYGREPEIRDLLERLRHQRFLLVIG